VVSYSPDGRILVTGENDGYSSDRARVRFRDAATGAVLHELNTEWNAVQDLSFARDGKHLASVDMNGVIQLWDVATGKRVRPADGSFAPVNLVAICHDGRTVIATGNPIRCFDLSTGREQGRLPAGHWLLAASADGRLVATCHWVDRTFHVWDPVKRQSVSHFAWVPRQAGAKLANFLMSAAFSADGSRLTITGVEETGDHYKVLTRIWDAATGKELSRTDWTGATPREVAYSPNGRSVATIRNHLGNGNVARVSLFDVLDGGKPRVGPVIDIAHFIAVAGSGEAEKVAFSSDGRMFAANGDREIVIWETVSGRERLHLRGHKAGVKDLRFSPQAEILASCALDGVRIWDVRAGKEIDHLKGHRGWVDSLAFSADGRTLVSGGSDTTMVVWDASRFAPESIETAAALGPDDLEAAWPGLADADAAKVYATMQRMIASPELTVRVLKGHLEPAIPWEPARLSRLVAELESGRFAVREKASQELARADEEGRSRLEKAWAQAGESSETRLRLRRILDEMAVPGDKELQALRGVEVLEHIGTSAARAILERLAKGAASARLTLGAKEALQRLSRRPNHGR
jgi:WD40 repeat protein